MRSALAGNAADYRVLLDELSRHLRGYFGRRLGRDRGADAEDLVQDTLFAIHAHRATYDPERPFTVWVHALARYKLIDHLRRQRARPTVPLDDADMVFAADDHAAATAKMDVERLMATMPPRQQALLRDVKLEGRSIAEVAARSGVSEAAVKVGVHRGVKALAMRLRGRKP